MTHKHFTGLTLQQAEESLKKYGPNVLTPPKRDPLWKLFLRKFEDPVIRVLLIAAFLSFGISFITNEFAETIGIFFAIILATGVAFWFEMNANRKFDILNLVNNDIKVKVIREGNIFEIPRRNVVTGDIVLLETGEEVPADGELLEAVSLQLDESCLTGEPMISKTTRPEDFKPDVTYPSNWVMRGTKVMDGHGAFEVRLVGDSTEYGKVAMKASEMTGEVTPLNRQLDGLAKFIGVVGFSIASLTFIVLFVRDLLQGSTSFSRLQLGSLGVVLLSAAIALTKVWLPIVYDAIRLSGKQKQIPKSVDEGSWLKWTGLGIVTFAVLCGVGYISGIDIFSASSWVSVEMAGQVLKYFMVAVTLIVVTVPEGLPMSVTLSLALSMRKMLQANNLVRKMHACETMGATTVICTDKTGTLTQNQMQVHDTNFYCLPGQQPDGENARLIAEGIAVNTTAFLDFSNQQKPGTIGNPTEAALLLWLHRHHVNYLSLREDAEIKDQLTFSTERKYMATIADSQVVGKPVLYVKGAPEIVMNKCKKVLTETGLVSIEDYKQLIVNQLEQYQNQAMRTLGFAYEVLENGPIRFASNTLDTENLIFLGIVAISDPVRKDVPHAVETCGKAGIAVKIVTGDTPGTAKEIGRQIGIWNESCTDENIISGLDFEKMPDAEARLAVNKIKIMCRARPTDKQRFVQLLQRNDEVVAVTGDGTNDAPALNHANVGLSMGSGTSVAKEASDITLLDDSFASIATAVMWGRSLYQNIQRFIIFQLTINVAALTIVFLGSIIGHELPLTVTQMLWVNLIMDTFAAGALASLPPNPGVMNNRPRKNSDFIITPTMRRSILFVAFAFVAVLLGLMYYFTDNHTISDYNLSKFFTIFVLLQFWNIFNAKAYASGSSAFKNLHRSYGFIFAAVAILVGQILIVQFGGSMFRTVPLKLGDWLTILGSTSIVLVVGEIMRLIQRKRKQKANT